MALSAKNPFNFKIQSKPDLVEPDLVEKPDLVDRLFADDGIFTT